MTVRFSPITFLATYCLGYSLELIYDAPLFRYYPLHNLLTWGPDHVSGHGPAIVWYGILANALFVSTLTAFVLSDRWLDRVFRNFVLVFPILAMGLSIGLMWKFFV